MATLHILGAGSIGLLWAYYLRQAGHDVTLILRPPYTANVQPLRLTDTQGQPLPPISVSCVDSTAVHHITTLLVCTKAFAALEAVSSVAHALQPDSAIVLLQNGMGSQQSIVSHFPQHVIYAASSTAGARKIAPFCVQHTGIGATEWGVLSAHDNACDLATFLSCKLTLERSNDIQATLWRKLLINCCINPLTVIFDCNNGELATLPAAQNLMHDILQECFMVAAAAGMTDALNGIEQRLLQVIQATASNSSSMREDAKAQRRTEIDFINGAICHLADTYAIQCPTNHYLWNSIRQL